MIHKHWKEEIFGVEIEVPVIDWSFMPIENDIAFLDDAE